MNGKKIAASLPNKVSVAEGAFGVVHWERRNGIKVAVKEFRVPDTKDEDILKEAALLSKLTNPYIIQYYDLEEVGEGQLQLVMEYAEGGNLADAKSRLDWMDKMRVVTEIARGLAFLHAQGIIHRDIKAANILLTAHDQVKLCDFGLSKTMGATTTVVTHGRVVMKGTPGWMAPELLGLKPDYSAKSDIYALGVVMHEIGGREMPLDYAALAERCLDKDPKKRPTVEEIMDAFKCKHQEITRQSLSEPTTAIDPEEQYKLGMAHYDGEGVLRNRAEAWQRFLIAANMGHVEAQFHLANMYFHGSGIARDFRRAAEWFQRAAAQGHSLAQNHLGGSYQRGGEGVPQDYAKAKELFQMAAYHGIGVAQSNLGGIYYHGQGVPQDKAESVEWFRLAAESGDAHGQNNLSCCYSLGDGIAQDFAEAFRWRQMAAEQGHPVAQYALGVMYYVGRGVDQDYAEAARWFQKASDSEHADAQYILGMSYLKGVGVRRSWLKGKKLLESAADQGHVAAQHAMGVVGPNE